MKDPQKKAKKQQAKDARKAARREIRGLRKVLKTHEAYCTTCHVKYNLASKRQSRKHNHTR